MLLAGKKGLVLNVTNEKSIGWSVADEAWRAGATVGIGGQSERMMKNVGELAASKPERMFAHQIDFGIESDIEALVEAVRRDYGALDFFVHSAAFAPREALQGRFIDTSRDAFNTALEVSCYSLVRMCKALEPVMNDGASIITMSYLGSVRACANYNVMGVAKAALESAVRYLAVDLGPRGIRVNTVSPGPMNTVAARGVKGLLDMITHVGDLSPLKRAATQEDVGRTSVYLLSDLSSGVTGQVIYVDSGYNVVAL
jgi:enoyl-[acyl-carrier protein] reductase I